MRIYTHPAVPDLKFDDTPPTEFEIAHARLLAPAGEFYDHLFAGRLADAMALGANLMPALRKLVKLEQAGGAERVAQGYTMTEKA